MYDTAIIIQFQEFETTNEVSMEFKKKRPFSSIGNESITTMLKLLSSRDRRKLIIVVLINIILAILDLLGVLLIGVLGSLSINGIASGQVGNRVSAVLRLLGINDSSYESQAIIIGLIAASLLIFKTILSLYFVKRVVYFMGRRAAALSASLVSKYFAVSVLQINQRSAHNSIYALTNGVTTLMVGVVAASIALLADIALLFVMGIGLLLVDPITAISTALVFGSFATLLYLRMHRVMKKLGEEQTDLNIEISQKIFEAISSYRELLVRDRRRYYAQQIGRLRYRLADGNAEINYLSTFSKYVLEITLVLCALMLAFYQFSTSTAFRAFATIAIFVAASTRIMPAILRLQQGLLKIKSAIAEAKPTLSLIEELSEVYLEEKEIRNLSRTHLNFIPEVRASNLNFSYLGDHQILKNVNFSVNSGEFVAIVGGSGSGKTTLVDLLLGALETQKGDVHISGLAPRLAFERWPGAVAYVPQDSPIIDGTIRENLALGYKINDLSDDICWEALRVAQLDKFVSALPDQLETYVGDRGTSLSGGQRQRLGIARALITRPKMLFLDEATSSLDGITEHEVAESLRSFKGEITLIVIAHRLATVVNANRIYYLKDGRVKKVGTFEELKANSPEFLEQARLMGL
jgi:ABC-type multidrug transport system fused ATPase/permease subunit